MPRLSLLILSDQGAYDGKYFDFLINFCKKRQAFVVMFIDLNRLFWNIISLSTSSGFKSKDHMT